MPRKFLEALLFQATAIRIFASLTLTCATFLVVPRTTSAVTISTVAVGNPGNASDPDTGSLYGSVGYNYRIGTNEVTNAQYVEFLNTKDPTGTDTLALWNSNMGSPSYGINFNAGNTNGSKYSVAVGQQNLPVGGTSWYDDIRFANWLNNGQGNGNTETGSYTLGPLGAGGVPIDGNAIVRNSGATWVLPTENEWYKAAYYNPASSSYFLFPTSNNNVPTAEPPPGGSNSANWNAIGGLTAVGAYLLSPSPYGTFDQAGNVMEWNETLIDSLDRGVRGGAFGSMTFGYDLSSHARSGTPATTTQLNLGFRVAMIPEPSTGLLASLGGLALLVCRRCRH